MIAKSISLMFMLSTGFIWDAPTEAAMLASNEDGVFTAETDPGPALPVPLSPKKRASSPEETVNGISARANDWTEPSLASENQYVAAVRNWLQTLEPGRRETARKIMRDAHPALSGLRKAIRDKKAQLANISFGRDTQPETLPRLGVELQKLRAALHAELSQLKKRLAREAGVDMGPLARDTFWLSLPNPPPKIRLQLRKNNG